MVIKWTYIKKSPRNFTPYAKTIIFLGESVQVKARVLSSEKAIGNPEGNDFPLQKGKERLMQAQFESGTGQAFTDRYGDFTGKLKDIISMPLQNDFRRAVFIASLNAVLHHLNRIQGTVHCRDEGPALCAEELIQFLKNRHGKIKITQVGFQPRILEFLSKDFQCRILDLDQDNIGKCKFGVPVEGPEATVDAVSWADLLMVTGTTIVNGTIEAFLDKKLVIFYGTTIAGASHLMNWDRFCAKSS